MTCHRVCKKSNITGITSRTEAAYPSGAPEFTLDLGGAHVVQSLLFAIVLSVLLITASDYTFGIPKTFLKRYAILKLRFIYTLYWEIMLQPKHVQFVFFEHKICKRFLEYNN